MNKVYLSKLDELLGTIEYRNLTVPELVEQALSRGECEMSGTGAVRVVTGKCTGRSPDDRFIVDDDASHDTVDWGEVNKPISPEAYYKLRDRLLAYLQNRTLFVFDGFAGTSEHFRLPVRVINEWAVQNLFAHQMLVRPGKEELLNFHAEFTVISAPEFKADPKTDSTNSDVFICINFAEKEVLIGGTGYSGEIKKSIFTVMNYILTEKAVLPMHCSANEGESGDVALFFGLSGTGKTTLSADPNRSLIGDDEHGWSDEGVFNFEGGCYAKCIKLNEESEPMIWNAIRFGTMIENVVLTSDRKPDFDSDELTENTRAAYPINYISNSKLEGKGGHPSSIIFLTADAFGVLPPIARLDEEEAMYYFLSGYTSKLSGTERGITEPKATFSSCFGAPFLPRHPYIYAKILGDKIKQRGSRVFLVNTGWTGGPYGIGHRMKLSYTRAIVSQVLSGGLDSVSYQTDPIFGLQVPTSCPGVPKEILWPMNTWEDKKEYEIQARKLAGLFRQNFVKFSNVPTEITLAGPTG